MKHDISTLIQRSKERSAELSKRIPTREEIRWGARIALNGVPENDLAPPRWWQLPSHLRRFVIMKESGAVEVRH